MRLGDDMQIAPCAGRSRSCGWSMRSVMSALLPPRWRSICAHRPCRAALRALLARRKAGADLPAIAPRSAVAHGLRFEHGDLVAGLGELQRGRKPGIAGADDADIRRHIAFERRAAARNGVRGRLIIGAGVDRDWPSFRGLAKARLHRQASPATLASATNTGYHVTSKFEEWIGERKISEVECLVADMSGTARGKILPPKKFLKGNRSRGLRIPEEIFTLTINGRYRVGNRCGQRRRDRHLHAARCRHDPRSCPGITEPTAQVICDAFHLNDEPVDISPRHVLKPRARALQGKGLAAGGRARARILSGQEQSRSRLSARSGGRPLRAARRRAARPMASTPPMISIRSSRTSTIIARPRNSTSTR